MSILSRITDFWNNTPNTDYVVKNSCDFSSEKDLSHYFISDEWNNKNMDTDHKVDLFQELENRKAAEYGIKDPCKICALNDDRFNGYYDNYKNCIYINFNQDSSIKCLDTLYHENTHQLQKKAGCYMIECDNQIGNSDDILIRSESNPGIYTDGEGYKCQRCELDANCNAFLDTVDFCRKNDLCSDTEYSKYIANRDDYFNSKSYYDPGVVWNSSFNRSEMNDLSEHQIQQALKEGIISEHEHDLAINELRLEGSSPLLNRVSECGKLCAQEKENIENGICNDTPYIQSPSSKAEITHDHSVEAEKEKYKAAEYCNGIQ